MPPRTRTKRQRVAAAGHGAALTNDESPATTDNYCSRHSSLAEPTLQPTTTPALALASADADSGKNGAATLFQQQLQEMQVEMEVIVGTGTTAGRQRRKKIPRPEQKFATMQRRRLDRQDVDARKVDRDDAETSTSSFSGPVRDQCSGRSLGRYSGRLRGARAAEGDAVIQASLVYPASATVARSRVSHTAAASAAAVQEVEEEDDEVRNESEAEHNSASMEIESDVEDPEYSGSDRDDDDHDNNDEEDDIEGANYWEEEAIEVEQTDKDDLSHDEDNDDSLDVEPTARVASVNAPLSVPAPEKKKSQKRSRSRRTRQVGGAKRHHTKKTKLFRLRNFQSIRMADRHGDALASFARGQHKEAIDKLQQVAKDLPSAPQVYASLAMVYEQMLTEIQTRDDSPATERLNGHTTLQQLEDKEFSSIREGVLSEQLTVSKKAYGSYHIAALLCKKDYTFWVRAGDLAATIADIHSQVLLIPHVNNSDREHHRHEKQRWLSEAMNDYKTADNIKPPGIDIPAKLASVSMELGCLCESLTLLTDLKNRPASLDGERSEFESSSKAWMLYADLMLRIGYECKRWNDGDQTMNNVSFRRWLRIHSKTFDWKERRLQALGKALEAAAGTECCSRFTDWLQRRAISLASTSFEDETPDLSEGSEEQFECERDLLVHKNAIEIADFDKTTSEIDVIPGSLQSKQRNAARSHLLRLHDAAINELECDFGRRARIPKRQDLSPESDNTSIPDGPSMPLSASIRTVSAIASELMIHLLLLKLYDGGRLAGEVVSSYFKKRALLLTAQVQSRQRFNERYSRLTCVLTTVIKSRLDLRDDVREQISEDESDIALSDEDSLENGPALVVESLRKGFLPPALNVLFSLSMLGEKGRDFVALKCLQSIESLDQENLTYFLESDVDIGVSYDTRWSVFKRRRSGIVFRTEAFALVDSVLRESGREREIGGKLLPLFETYLKKLEALNLVRGSKIRSDLSVNTDRLALVIKVVTATVRLQIRFAEHLFEQSQLLSADALLQKASDTLMNALDVVWRLKPKNILPPYSFNSIETLASLFKLRVSWLNETNIGEGLLLDWVKRMGRSVLLLCGCSSCGAAENVTALGIKQFPLSSKGWLTDTRKAIALRTYNLSVSHNVARFSGWEEEEFRMEMMKRQLNTSSYFGISMSEGIVSGLLEQYEGEVLDQWDNLGSELSEASFCRELRDLVETRRVSQWYRDAKEAYMKASLNSLISVHKEESGISILLAYSRCSILLSQELDDENQQSFHLFNALSVLLPITQFMVQHLLWDADVGKVPETRVLDWGHIASAEDKANDEFERHSRPRSRRLVVMQESEINSIPLYGTFANERATPLISNLIVVPNSTLLHAWNLDPHFTSPEAHIPTAISELMIQLNRCMQQLRRCHSERAVETASIHVAVASLNLMAHPHCSDPFFCLQSAALFAGQGSKLGISDRYFKQRLPNYSDCSALDALVVLGRAECLLSLHFCAEAAFLCDFVALVVYHVRHKSQSGSVGSLTTLNNEAERAPQHPHLMSLRWRVVSALAYNTSVLIRQRAHMVYSNESEKRTDSSVLWTWSQKTVHELLCGRDYCRQFLDDRQAPPALVPAPIPLRQTGGLPSWCCYSSEKMHHSANCSPEALSTDAIELIMEV